MWIECLQPETCDIDCELKKPSWNRFIHIIRLQLWKYFIILSEVCLYYPENKVNIDIWFSVMQQNKPRINLKASIMPEF
jgi:hypothetical protein